MDEIVEIVTPGINEVVVIEDTNIVEVVTPATIEVSIEDSDNYEILISSPVENEIVVNSSPAYEILIDSPTVNEIEVLGILPQEGTPASETAEGVIELATQIEVNAGTDITKAVTPATLKGYHDAQNKPDQFGLIIDGGGSVITTGQKLWRRLPFACTITGWVIMADVTGNIVLDLWKDNYTNFPPAVADTITGTDKPTLTTQLKNSSTALTGWNVNILAGDIILFNVDSVSTITKVELFITYEL